MYTDQQLKKISSFRDKKERLSWNRKRKILEDSVAELNELNEQILKLMEEKNMMFDEIQVMRKIMIAECVHPFDMLVAMENSAKCKFCNKVIRLNEED
jgi:protein-tyrosine-phosphatase